MSGAKQIDSFFIILGGVLILLSAIVIFTFRTIFTAFSVSGDILDTDVSNALNINESVLQEAKNFAFGQRVIAPLSIKNDGSSVPVSITPTPRLSL